MSFQFKSVNLLNELNRRRRQFDRPIAARIVVPEDLKWWYYHEHGTATHRDSGSTGPYTIRPVNAKWLTFPDPTGEYGSDPGMNFGDGYAHRLVVHHHPGVRATHMIQNVLGDIDRMAKAGLAQAIIQSGYNYDAVRARMMDLMAEAKQIIVQSIDENLPGTREDGRLLGRSAAEDFNERASIKEASY